ncbi:MAG: bifunctional UDP-N-acetylmuramoyl-tripeptide:D-alanyl-D-alanine ligase/alanine racemase [Saprospiraceae bacterium]|nr:bifunctional UDP-N-acetylmuramoyl-tripeptide:D-alanyl-D-alanine ligase/alanine racemase [Saprospiraceae bacterium]
MIHYNIHDIIGILNAEIISKGNEDVSIRSVETDSRYISNPEESLFFALDGVHTSGHLFIPELAEKGIRVFVTHQSVQNIPGVWILKVNDTLQSLQSFAAHHRHQFKIPVIAITGSNGKAITKEWLSQILSSQYVVCRNPKSYNSQLGVALSVLDLNSTHQLGIFEAGISKNDEMAKLENIISPELGIFTNIGDAHDSGFINRFQKIKEKKILFKNCRKYIYCGDYADLHEVLKEDQASVSWGVGSHNDIHLQIHKQESSDLPKVTFTWENKEIKLDLPFQDQASIENVMHCIIMSLILGLSESMIQSQISKLHGLRLRLEQKEGLQDCILINDSYSLDLKSLALACRFLDQQNKNLKRSLVISDFANREHDDNLLSELSRLIEQFHILRVVTIGDRILQLRNFLDPKIKFHHFNLTESLIEQSSSIGFNKECILIKGARQFKLEKFFQSFSLSSHDTILEVDLQAILHNVSVYKSLLNSNTKIMAVVKASAYGSGQYEIARFLEHKGIDFLAVAYPDEGILLRQKGIQSRIMVMNTAHADFEELLEYNLETEIFSIKQLERLISVGSQNPIEIHLKIESGMNRLGFDQSEWSALIQILNANTHFHVASIFSHLSGSDRSEFDDFTNQQFDIFKHAFDLITENIGYKPLAHILNSGGISRHPEMQLDMIRLGIGLYGIDSDPLIRSKLEIVHTLKTRIAQIKDATPHQTVSYNRSGILMRNSRIAVLSMGYADGLPRMAGDHKFKVFLQGLQVPLIGVVCMDMCMIDITDIDGVSEGAEVEIFGKNNGIQALAMICNTIPYEILCGISTRVRRVFVE